MNVGICASIKFPKAVEDMQDAYVCVCMLHGFDTLQMTQKLQVKYLMLIWY